MHTQLFGSVRFGSGISWRLCNMNASSVAGATHSNSHTPKIDISELFVIEVLCLRLDFFFLSSLALVNAILLEFTELLLFNITQPNWPQEANNTKCLQLLTL